MAQELRRQTISELSNSRTKLAHHGQTKLKLKHYTTEMAGRLAAKVRHDMQERNDNSQDVRNCDRTTPNGFTDIQSLEERRMSN